MDSFERKFDGASRRGIFTGGLGVALMAIAASSTASQVASSAQRQTTEDLKKIDAPVDLMHGEDDQIVPIADAALIGVKLLEKGTLKTYPGLPHGMRTTHSDVVNPDLLAFIKA